MPQDALYGQGLDPGYPCLDPARLRAILGQGGYFNLD